MLFVNLSKEVKHFSIDVSFYVNKEIVVLVGPSGAGKTTILNCIAGLTSPDKGKITLNSRLLFHNHRKTLPIQNRHIGYLFQDYALFPHISIKKNITYGMKDESLVQQLIDVVGIDHLLSSYPHQISGGEKQRVALTRALATRPEALLLDEPFSALDSKTRIACQDELLRLHNSWEIPIIMVTHNEEEAMRLGDRILRIHNGKIVEDINKSTLKNL